MFVWRAVGNGAMFVAVHSIIAMTVFRTAICFAGCVFYLVFKQFFPSEPQSATPIRPASQRQVPLSEEDNRLELMKETDQPA